MARWRWLWLATVLFTLARGSSSGAVLGVGAIGLTVHDLDREAAFFTDVLGFERVESETPAVRRLDDLFGYSPARTRSVTLRLGDEAVLLTEHVARKGRSLPGDSRSNDHWFQHIAIVVADMDRAYEHLRRAGVRYVSTAPQRIPDWNPDAGGIRAFYFNDPEGHVLEVIWFPEGKGDPRWQRPTGRDGPLFLGIDHTAIVVSDTERSLAFYRDVLGFRVAGHAENWGTEQEHLNQVFGARVRITVLRAPRGPGVEFLEYLTPSGGRSLPEPARANDLVFWTTAVEVDALNSLKHQFHERKTLAVSKRIDTRADRDNRTVSRFIVRDPDGHALELKSVDARVSRLQPE